jgi:hypothetical protein
MVRALPFLLLVAACGSDPQRPPAEEAPDKRRSLPAAVQAPAPADAKEQADQSEDAATALRLYYGLIAKRKYEQAARLRSRGAGDAGRLADTFKAYRSYHVQVGTPGRPARSGAWLFVNVPVMITGSFKGGEAFGSAGSVTMRRAVSDEAPPGERGWRVYTG